MEAGRAIARQQGNSEFFIVGGAVLYEAALPHVERLYLTEVDAAPEGDAFFPALASDGWQELSREHHAADDRNDHAFDIVMLERA